MTMKPNKEFRGFDHFLNVKRPYEWDMRFPISYWCAECDGRGKIVDPEYEPYYQSHTEYIKCPKCSGTKVGSLKDLKLLYENWRRQYQLRLDAYKEQKSRFEQLTKGMSRGDLQFVKDWQG